MPRINEGLNDVVRTHMIFSPTRTDMIQANHPNACNLCHTDKPIDWTLDAFKKWYGKTYDEKALARTYPRRSEPAALGWLASEQESVRLVAADALTRTKNRTALPQLLNALDDPFLLNRQFTAKGLEDMLGLRLADSGYRFYMTHPDRQKPIAELAGNSFSRETSRAARSVSIVHHASLWRLPDFRGADGFLSPGTGCPTHPHLPLSPRRPTRHDRRGRGSGHA